MMRRLLIDCLLGWIAVSFSVAKKPDTRTFELNDGALRKDLAA